MLSLQIEEAKDKLLKYREQQLSEEEKTYVNSKLWRCKLHYSWMFEVGEFPELDTSLILPIDSFYFQFYRTGEFKDIGSMKKKILSEPDLYKRVDYALQFSMYQFYKRDERLKNANSINQAIYNDLESIPFTTSYHLDLYYMMINLSSEIRKNERSLVLCHKLLGTSRNIVPLPDIVKSRILNQRILTYTRLANSTFAISDVEKVDQLLAKYKCTPEYQTFLKNAIYANLYTNVSEEINNSKQEVLKYDSIFQETVRTCQNDFANYHRVKGQILSEWGDHTNAELNWAKALKYINQSLLISEAVYHSIIWYLSNSLEKMNRFEEAYETYELKKQYSIDSDKQNNFQSFTFIDSERLASIQLNKWKMSKLPVNYQKADSLLQNAYQSFLQQVIFLNEEAILRLYGNKQWLVKSALDFYFEAQKQNPSVDNKEQFFKFASLKKNLLLQRDMLLFQSDSILTPDTRNKEASLKKEIKTIDETNPENWSQLEHLLNEQDTLEDQILNAYNSAKLNIYQSKQRNQIIDIVNSLGKDQIFIDYYLFDTTLYTMSFNHLGSTIYKKHVSNLKSDIDSLNEIQSQHINIPVIEYQYLANRVYNQLLGQLRYNEPNKQLTISADGIINFVSFQALVKDINTEAKTYNEIPYLVHDYEIDYTFSSSNRIEINSEVIDFHSKVVAFSFSDPESILLDETTDFTELPYAYSEVLTIEKQYPNTIIFAGRDATKANFLKTINDPSVDMIHLSLHGMSNSAKRDDVKLYFRTKDLGVDSLLGYELLGLKTKVSRIVLKACESGIGKIDNDEGIFSLNRYLHQIGIESIKSSLWKIESKGNSEIIKERNNSIFIKNNEDYSHPYFWAHS